ncbi:MAG TPA: 5'/3'-nucleotidase SurE [Anaerolineae bacterium]|nr:5'/3'-nucleotidase SurE [Anaerolineae bacterium]
MHFLVTNDDGVKAPGLLALSQTIRELGKVTVLAPDHNWSASGHVKTMYRPLRVKPVRLADDMPAQESDGAPSDCVALSVLGLLDEAIDFVVSGINPNANLGHDLTYSGTVTAAMEAAISGLPGVAVSLDAPEYHSGPLDFSAAARVAAVIVKEVVRNKIPKKILLNVNVPYLPFEEIKGYRITRQGLRVYRDKLIRREDPRGRPYYWIGGKAPTGIPEEGTDVGALSAGYVSITPVSMEMTAYGCMENLQSWNFSHK